MQIFEYDYKTGKGKKLGDFHLHGCGLGVGKTNGMVIHEYIYPLPDYNDPEWEYTETTADTYGVEAITCCLGQDQATKKWEWIVVCNKEHAKKAKARNLKDFGHEHWRFIKPRKS